MGQANLRGLLAFSVILALGSGPGWTKPVLPDLALQPGTLDQGSEKSDQPGTDPRVAEPSDDGGEVEPAAEARETGFRRSAEEATPAREEKTDCDECVIVLPEGVEEPSGTTAGSPGMAGTGHLAGTLWGLFMVARPRRLPRTIIRGVTVP